MAATEFGLLGPLMVRRDGVALPVRAGKQRTLLAALLLSPNQLVTMADITETLWGPQPPPSARVTVQNYVKRLRDLLTDTGRAQICTQPGGYLIRVGADELDVTRFEALLKASRRAAGAADWEQAAQLAAAAVRLWRGEPLADVTSEALAAREIPRLTELRLQAQEAHLGAMAHLGRQAEVIAELQRLASLHPLREHLYTLLMLALCQSGRRAEALATYQQARRVLVSQLGTGPGAELQDMHLRILRAGTVPVTPPRCSPGVRASGPGVRDSARAGPAVPRELPPTVPHFAGRQAELGRLASQLTEAVAGTVVITAIGGMAGVGKTALAVHWGHQLTERFPDGQLYVNLRGFDPSGAPVTPEQALRAFLATLQVATEKVPVTAQAQAGLYRTLLAGRRMLIVLDNARDEQQVRPLLPASPTCLVIVTSRSPLAGLVAADGARPVALDVLSDPEARQLLARRLGERRVSAEPAAVTELASLCGRLPLALAIAAARAAAHPRRPLASLAAELRDRRSRLAALDAGEAATSIRAVFSWSCRGLSPPAARMFRLLSLHPGPDVTVAAAASLAGASAEAAGDLLRELARAGLLAEPAAGRFTCHDLLRAYAAGQVCAAETPQQRRSALTGLIRYYLAAAAAATQALFPGDGHHRARPPVRGLPTVRMGGMAASRDWLDAERASLVAVTTRAADGWPGYTIRLAEVLYRYLEDAAHFRDSQTVCAAALRAARHTGDVTARAGSLRSLARIDIRQGDVGRAARRARQAWQLYRDLANSRGQAQTLLILGHIEWRTGRPPQSVRRLRQALAIFREIGDRSGESKVLANLGLVVGALGHLDEAAGYQREALAIGQRAGNRADQALARCQLGLTLCLQGRYQQAMEFLGQALALYRDLHSPGGEADALTHLGRTFLAQGRYHEAVVCQRAASVIFRDTGILEGRAESLNGLAEALLGAGSPGVAGEHYRQALALAQLSGSPREQARANAGLARAYAATGDRARAGACRQLARDMYASLGLPMPADRDTGPGRAGRPAPGLDYASPLARRGFGNTAKSSTVT
jgi:DNA-binding SARP family transcriptional activator